MTKCKDGFAGILIITSKNLAWNTAVLPRRLQTGFVFHQSILWYSYFSVRDRGGSLELGVSNKIVILQMRSNFKSIVQRTCSIYRTSTGTLPHFLETMSGYPKTCSNFLTCMIAKPSEHPISVTFFLTTVS